MREWKKIEGFDFKEIIFEEYNHIAKITINRERYRNAFTPLTTGGSHLCDVQYLLAHILTYEGEGARRIVLGHRTCIDKRMLKLQQFLLRIHRNRQSQEEKR